MPACAQRLERAQELREDERARRAGGAVDAAALVDRHLVAQLGRQPLERHRVAGHHPEGLDVDDEAGGRAVGPALHRLLGRDAVEGRVDLDRREALRVVGEPLAGGQAARVPVLDERLVGEGAGADAHRRRHPRSIGSLPAIGPRIEAVAPIGHAVPGRRSRTSRAPARAGARSGRLDARPIGVFDSGVGGLTVLHECLVTLPNEDFVYLGDHARLPYGPRPLAEISRFAHEIAGYLAVAGRQADRRRLQHRDLGGAARAAGIARGAGRRRDRARGRRRGARDAQPADRAARDRGDRRAPAATRRSSRRSTPASASPPSPAPSSCR